MRIAYDILISLTITHPYFSDKVLEGFELEPDTKTTLLLKELKLITKKRINSWYLLFQTDGPFATKLSSLVDKEFLFTLLMTESSFYSITDDSYLPGHLEMLFFNSPINSIMIPEKRKVYPLKFNYVIHHAVRPVNFKVTTAKGKELLNEVITDKAVTQKEIDLTPNGENIYNIAEDTVPAGSLENEKIFAKEDINAGPFYGTVYFKILPVLANDAVNHFRINVESINQQ